MGKKEQMMSISSSMVKLEWVIYEWEGSIRESGLNFK
jgi:hypothetical protein